MPASALILDGHRIVIDGREPTIAEIARAWLEAEARIAFLEQVCRQGSSGYIRQRPKATPC